VIGDTIYAWQELNDNGWGIIAAVAGVMISFEEESQVRPSLLPLVTRNLEIAQTVMLSAAKGHQESSDNPIRLAQFNLVELLG